MTVSTVMLVYLPIPNGRPPVVGTEYSTLGAVQHQTF